MIYVLCFMLSILLMFLSNKVSNILFKKILVLLSLLLPCFLASVRDYSIGTDVNIYIRPLYILAEKYDNFFNYYMDVNIVKDLLYLLITYISAKIGNIGLLFFLIEALIVFPIYFAMKNKYENFSSVLFGLFIFYFFFYNQTLNMARQSIAIAFVIYGLSLMEKEKNKHALFMFIISYMFHNTAIVSIPLYMIFKLYKNKTSNQIYTKNKLLLDMVLVIISLLVVAMVRPVLNIFGSVGLFSVDKVANYSINYYRESLDFSFINTFIYFSVFSVLFMNKDKIQKIDSYSHFYLMISLISIIILQLGVFIAFADRIVYYLFYPVLFLELPQVYSGFRFKYDKKNLLSIYYIVFIFVAYWIYWICFLNYNGTFPFVYRVS